MVGSDAKEQEHGWIMSSAGAGLEAAFTALRAKLELRYLKPCSRYRSSRVRCAKTEIEVEISK